MSNVLIIEDEPRAVNLLTTILKEHCKEISEIYTSSKLLDGIEIIKKNKIDILFLDIELPQHSGLQLLDFIDKDEIKFQIIFTTAYSKYAIDAFKFSAIDYLLKPLQPTEVKSAVSNALRRYDEILAKEKLDQLQYFNQNQTLNKIALNLGEKIMFVEVEHIIFLKASGMYTYVFLKSTNELLVSKPLKHFDPIIESNPEFYKPHRSYIINLSHVKQFIKKEGYTIIMDDETNIPLSREKKEDFFKKMSIL